MIKDDAAEALARAEFFDICDEEQRRMLAFAGETRVFGPTDVLYRAGDRPEGAIVLIRGTLHLKPEGPGQAYKLNEPGSVISALSLVLDKPRPLTVTALSTGAAVIVPRAAFRKLMQQSPDLAGRVSEWIKGNMEGYLGALEPLRKRMQPNSR